MTIHINVICVFFLCSSKTLSLPEQWQEPVEQLHQAERFLCWREDVLSAELAPHP